MVANRILHLAVLFSLLVILTVLLACTRVDEEPPPTQIPPSPTSEPNPPTATPVPPTPTPTPAPKVAFVQQYDWYTSDLVDEPDRDALVRVVEEIADNYPDLCDAMVEEDLLSVRSYAHIRPLTANLEQFTQIAAIDEGSAVRLARMDFTKSHNSSVKTAAMRILVAMAEFSPRAFPDFLDHEAIPANITIDWLNSRNYNDGHEYIARTSDAGTHWIRIDTVDSIPDEIEDLFHPFLQLADPETATRIENLYPTELNDSSKIADVLRYNSFLAIFYPAVFSALMNNVGGSHLPMEVSRELVHVARADEQTAIRVASLPFLSDVPFESNSVKGRQPLFMLAGAAAVNPERTIAALDRYEHGETLIWPSLTGLRVELIGIFDPYVERRLRSAPWLQDGIDRAIKKRVNGVCEIRYGEDDLIFEFTHKTILFDKELVVAILREEWLQQDELSWREVDALELFETWHRDAVSNILGMQFLDTLELEDLFTLYRLAHIGAERGAGNLPYAENLAKILAHDAIGGEITDRNQDELEDVIDELILGPSVGTARAGYYALIAPEYFDDYTECNN